MTLKLNNIFKAIFYFSIGYFTYLMVLITLQYFPIKLDAAFLNIKQEELKIAYYKYAFFIHVYTSIIVLIIGLFQFSKTIRNNFKALHRNFGKAYILFILFSASPTGLIMAIHANGGIYSKISFCIQAILWFSFTLQAYRFAIKKNWPEHEKFMLRSIALTLSAISLRLFKWIIVSTLELPPMDTYKIVAWLGWVFNLAIIEIYIKWYWGFRSTKTNSAIAPLPPHQ